MNKKSNQKNLSNKETLEQLVTAIQAGLYSDTEGIKIKEMYDGQGPFKYRITALETMYLYESVRTQFYEKKTPNLYLSFDSDMRLAAVFQDKDLSILGLDHKKLIEMPSDIVHNVVASIVDNRHNGSGTEIEVEVSQGKVSSMTPKSVRALDSLLR